MTETQAVEQTVETPALPDDFEAFEAVRRGVKTEQSASVATAEQKTEQKAETAVESEATDDTGEGQEDEQAGQPKKGKGGFQRKIDRLTREKYELEAKLQAALAKPAGGEKPEPAAAAANDGKPQAENFDTHDEYVEALVDWKANQREAAKREQEQRDSETKKQQATVDSWNQRVEAARKAHADYDDVMADADVELPPLVVDALMDSDHGGELAYWLASNREEAERIAKLSPVAAVRKLGEIEAGLRSTPSSPQPKPVTKAPKPVTPVAAGTASPVPSSSDLDTDDFAAYEQARRRTKK